MSAFGECMQCGRSVEAEKAAKEGGRRRFCSDLCIEYFDAGWRANLVDHNTFVGYAPTMDFSLHRSVSGRSKSEAAKYRAKVAKKRAFAESWKKYQAKQKAATDGAGAA